MERRSMGQILVRNLDDSVIERLKQRALKADKSLEQTVRDLLTEAAKPSKEELWAEIDRLRESAGPVTLDATDLIREDRDNDEPYR
jgi:antitoxin FitA